LAKFAQALPQTNIVERPEGELDESPKLALQPREHRAELFASLPLLTLQSFRIGITSIGGDGATWPMRHSLSGIRVAEGENEIERRRVSASKVLPGFSLMAGGSSTAPADAMKSLDPDQAPIAAVDRFSDKAANIQVRTPDNHLPRPNEPVDFDTGPFITQGLSPSTGKPVRYYNFDIQSTTPAPVYVLYREGEDKPVAGQLDIIDTLSGEKGYNDFRQVWRVWVPKDYVPNTITDAGALSQAGYKTENTNTLRNMPVVPDKSTARERLK